MISGSWIYRKAACVSWIGLSLIATACATTQDCPPAGIKTVYQTVTKEVQVPCKVTIPTRPGAVIVKPGDDANAIALRQKAVLDQWGGAGESYANLAEAALRACIEAGKE